MRSFWIMLAVDTGMLALACGACAIISNCSCGTPMAVVLALGSGAGIYSLNQFLQHRLCSRNAKERIQKLAWEYLSVCCRHCNTGFDSDECAAQEPGAKCSAEICHLAKGFAEEYLDEHV